RVQGWRKRPRAESRRIRRQDDSGCNDMGSREAGTEGTLMDQLAPADRYSPYRIFSADEWAQFRNDTPLTLTEDEVRRLRSLNDPVDLEEVRRVYLSLSRLLSAHVEATQLLFEQRRIFFNA